MLCLPATLHTQLGLACKVVTPVLAMVCWAVGIAGIISAIALVTFCLLGNQARAAHSSTATHIAGADTVAQLLIIDNASACVHACIRYHWILNTVFAERC
jgi:hypothetical protein